MTAVNADERGILVQIFDNNDLPVEIVMSYFTVTKPGYVRGNHYHKEKTEYLFVTKGSCEIYLKNIKTDKTSLSVLDDKNYNLLMISPYELHKITNTGTEDLHLIAFSSKGFDINKPDTYKEGE